jgi:hypothetical protein
MMVVFFKIFLGVNKKSAMGVADLVLKNLI